MIKTINTFRGVNRDQSGATQLIDGEAESMVNFRITDTYKLKKITGYAQMFSSFGAYPIRGIWTGTISNVSHLLFACNGTMYRRDYLSSTDYASLDTATYTNVDVVITAALDTATAGSAGTDTVIRLINSAGAEMTEIAHSAIDNVASVGKYSYYTDKKCYIVVAKGAYANIAAARTGLGTETVYMPIGTLADAGTSFILKDNAVYILNGTEYYKWTGSGNIAAVTGYRPTIAINAPPAGGGTLYEEVNLLTGAKSQTFSTVTGQKSYVLAESSVDTCDSVYLNGVLLTITTEYTVDSPITTVTLVADPGDGTGNLRVNWTKANSANRALVTACKYASKFGNSDERVFLYGSGNGRLKSGIPVDGSTTAEYFEATCIDYLGVNITDICQQYDRQIIFSNDSTFYSYQEDILDSSDNTITSFPIIPLNSKVGCVAIGQSQLVQNTPYSVYKGVHRWEATNVRDERNEIPISKRVQPDLDDLDLSTAITYDYETLGEFWLCVGDSVWVHNYKVDVWYKFTFTDTPTCFIEIDGDMYFGTDNGEIMKFSDTLRSFNGTAINANWYMGFYDADEEWRRKYIKFIYLSLKPESNSKVDVYWETNKDNVRSTAIVVGYSNMNFAAAHFADWHFNGNYNPQPFRIKTKAKKWIYYRIIIENNSATYTAHVLSINLTPVLGGMSK